MPVEHRLKESTDTGSWIFGRSEEKRPLRVRFLKIGPGSRRPPGRVLIVAGQHGDEPSAQRAAEDFLRALRERSVQISAGELELAVIADANPDGAARQQRRNASGIDLNRDHQRLEAAETRALYAFVRRWRPHLAIDLHTYPPRRRHLSKRRLAYCHDVFVAGPTHPACLPPARRRQLEELVESVIEGVRHQGFRSEIYTLIRPRGRIRFSTLEMHDLRNWLALRHGIPTLLLEGQQPRKSDNQEAGRVKRALMTALLVACEQAARKRPRGADVPVPGEEIALRCSYAADGSVCRFEMKDLQTGRVGPISLKEEFRPAIRIRRSTRLPRAYAVPRRERPALRILERHGIAGQPGSLCAAQRVEAFRIRRLIDSRSRLREPRHPLPSAWGTGKRLVGSFELDQRPLDDHVVFRVPSEEGRALATLLEPRSAVGLASLNLLDLKEGDLYPILRIL